MRIMAAEAGRFMRRIIVAAIGVVAFSAFIVIVFNSQAGYEKESLHAMMRFGRDLSITP
jgi:hypothetical protein